MCEKSNRYPLIVIGKLVIKCVLVIEHVFLSKCVLNLLSAHDRSELD